MLDNQDKETFEKYAPFLGSHPVVFDVGACKGEYTDHVLSKIPGAKCFLFEPNTGLFNTLSHKNKYEIALSDKTGQIKFYMCSDEYSALSSTYEREVFKDVGSVVETVNSTTVDLFCAENGVNTIDLLKVDVEGAEFDVLRGSRNMMSEKKIKFIQVEYGGTYIDAGIKLADIIEYSGDFGYKAYKDGTLTTMDNFIEDYIYSLFLLTYIDLYAT